jgi:5,10-methenyltetrahydrofolate synthetase
MSELTIRQQKQVLRKHMRALRDAATPEQRAMWSAAICARVLASPAYKQARVIHCYLPIRSEVDPRPIIEHALAHGKRVAIPLWQAHTDETLSCEIDTLAEDAFEADGMGLRTPRRLNWVTPDEIDLVLVPLLAFAKLPLPNLPRGVPQGKNSVAPSPGTPGEGWGEGRNAYIANHAGEKEGPHLTSPAEYRKGGTYCAPSPLPGTPGTTPGEGWGGGESGYMRLGYGAGFYDRFLRRTRARRVGLAFALQRVNELPQTDTDTLLDDVITES